MSSLFSPPAPAAPPPLPAPIVDPAEQRRKEEERQAELRRRGMRGSILTSGLGDTRQTPVQRPNLLGQVGIPKE
jgi:hypothetical protein